MFSILHHLPSRRLLLAGITALSVCLPSVSTQAVHAAEPAAADSLPASKYGAYRPVKDLEYTSLPLLAFGFAAKADKKNFRAARNNFIPSYVNRWDDFLQHVPLLSVAAMKLCGYESRSSWTRFLASGTMSYAFMGLFTNSIKYSAKEMRPDGSTANSFPSGHTATAFVAATIMHKEYGLTRSPWWSVAGYGCATLTGIMRTLNNRHWISDVLVGAGIGVISADLGYMMGDYIFKDRGIVRTGRRGPSNIREHPSFFKLSLGTSIISDIDLPEECDYLRYAWLYPDQSQCAEDMELFPIQQTGDPFSETTKSSRIGQYRRIKVGTATSVGAEAAYYVTPYIGVGGRLRIATAPVYAEGLYCDVNVNGVEHKSTGSATDVLAMTDWAAGLYGSWPMSYHFALGGKVLYGRRYMGDLTLTGVNDIEQKFDDGSEIVTYYGDCIDLSAQATDMIGGGISATYSVGNGVALSVFYDFDLTHSKFDCEYWPDSDNSSEYLVGGRQFSFNQNMRSHTFGASMTVMF